MDVSVLSFLDKYAIESFQISLSLGIYNLFGLISISMSPFLKNSTTCFRQCLYGVSNKRESLGQLALHITFSSSPLTSMIHTVLLLEIDQNQSTKLVGN